MVPEKRGMEHTPGTRRGTTGILPAMSRSWSGLIVVPLVLVLAEARALPMIHLRVPDSAAAGLLRRSRR